jgi:hypothetical protein
MALALFRVFGIVIIIIIHLEAVLRGSGSLPGVRYFIFYFFI